MYRLYGSAENNALGVKQSGLSTRQTRSLAIDARTTERMAHLLVKHLVQQNKGLKWRSRKTRTRRITVNIVDKRRHWCSLSAISDTGDVSTTRAWRRWSLQRKHTHVMMFDHVHHDPVQSAAARARLRLQTTTVPHTCTYGLQSRTGFPNPGIQYWGNCSPGIPAGLRDFAENMISTAIMRALQLYMYSIVAYRPVSATSW